MQCLQFQNGTATDFIEATFVGQDANSENSNDQRKHLLSLGAPTPGLASPNAETKQILKIKQ